LIVNFDHLPVISVESANATLPPKSGAGSGMDSGIDMNEGMQFGDVLSSQDGTQGFIDELQRNPTAIDGGKTVQPGGKLLPGFSESELPLEPSDLVQIVPDTPISNLDEVNQPAMKSEQSQRIDNQFLVTGRFSVGELAAGVSGVLYKKSTPVPVSAESNVRTEPPLGLEKTLKKQGVVTRPVVANTGNQDAPLPIVGTVISKDNVLTQQVLDVIDAGVTSFEKSERFGAGEQTLSRTLASGVQPPTSEPNIQASTKTAANLPIAIPLKNSGWSGEFVGRMSLMVKGGLQEASIQLNPPELGRMQIKLSTDGDQVKILFTVQHAAAREAVEQAMPRLREMLEQGGLQLAQSDVADQSQSHRRENRVDHSPSALFVDEQEEGLGESVSEVSIVSPDSIVDYYI